MYVLMITEDTDVSTNKIAHWIKYLSCLDIVRINNKDKIQITDIHISPNEKTRFTIIINKHLRIDSENMMGYWYRRGRLQNCGTRFKINYYDGNSYKEALYESMNEFYGYEWEHISAYLHYLLRHSGIASMNDYFDLQSNRLINMEVAKGLGLNVPDTIVTNSTETVREFLERHPLVITKCINYPGSNKSISHEVISYAMSTNLFTLEDLEMQLSKHKTFQPTLFQEYINKEFEIRSFYLKGEIYSMAIFSQNNDKTKIDYRNYDDIKPNRNTPFVLPDNLESKLNKLMATLNFDTGSIDIIYNGDQYCFLEINTVGQFDWVSKECNYFIEKHISQKIVSGYGIK